MSLFRLFSFLCFLASPPCLGLSLEIGSRSYQTLKKGSSPTDKCDEAQNGRKKRSAQKQLPKFRPNLSSNLQTEEKFGDTVILNYRPIFVNCEFDECLWFDDNRYWRKGTCDSVGTQNSNADRLSQKDESCPGTSNSYFSKNSCKSKSVARGSSTMLARRFRREPAKGGPSLALGPSFDPCKDTPTIAVASGSASAETATASVTYQVRDGRYYSSCTWKKPQGFWRCV